MLHRMCCLGCERPSSPEDVNIRQVSIPRSKADRVATPVSIRVTALNRQENKEMRRIFEVGPTHVGKSPSKLRAVIKQRLLREPNTYTAPNPLALPECGSYDPDAQPMSSMSSLPGLPATSHQVNIEGVDTQAELSNVSHASNPSSSAYTAGSEHKPTTVSYSHFFPRRSEEQIIATIKHIRQVTDANGGSNRVFDGQNDANLDSSHPRRQTAKGQSSCYSPAEPSSFPRGIISKSNLNGESTRDNHPISQIRMSQAIGAQPTSLLKGHPFDDTASEPFSSDASLHLQNMRISQHLRSMSSFSDGSTKLRPVEMRSISSDLDCFESGADINHSRSTFRSASVELPFASIEPVVYPDQTDDERVTQKSLDLKGLASYVPSNLGNTISNHTFNKPVAHEVLSLSPNDRNEPHNYDRRPKTAQSAHIEQREDDHAMNDIAAGETFAMLSRAHGTLDGPSDRFLTVPFSSMPRPSVSTSRRGSTAENFDETAMLWSKAMTAHQERQASSRKPSRSSLSITPSAARRLSRKPSSTTDAGSMERRSNSSTHAIEIAPINTEHSFDLVTMAGRGPISHSVDFLMSGARNSVSQPHLPAADGREIRRDSALCLNDESQRSHSQPPSSSRTDLLEVPQITLTVPEPTPRLIKRAVALPEDRSELSAWSRYPSHNREERNGSAGLADNIVVRDFAPVLPIPEIDDNDTDSNDTGRRKRHKKKQRVARFRNMIWHVKNLSGWPARFVQRNSDYAQRGSGHRTSISLGGVLEYPELELIPGLEARMSPEWNESFAMTDMSGGRRSVSSHGAGRRLSSILWGAEQAEDGSPTERRGRKLSAIERMDHNAEPGTGWLSAFYSQDHSSTAASSRRRNTEFVSPFDGLSSNPDTPGNDDYELANDQFMSTLSLPLQLEANIMSTSPPLQTIDARRGMRTTAGNRFGVRAETMTRPRLRMAVSADEMRKSTRDLREVLQWSEEQDAERAVEAAAIWEANETDRA